MNDAFYATLKLITGEEVLAEAILSEENGVEFFLLHGAITVEQTTSIDSEKGVATSGLTPKKWPLFSSDDLTIVYKDKVVTVSELDDYGRKFYQKALITARISNPVKRKMEGSEHTGYLGSTKEVRERLEKLFLEDYPDD